VLLQQKYIAKKFPFLMMQKIENKREIVKFKNDENYRRTYRYKTIKTDKFSWLLMTSCFFRYR
jgi:hypothetical protein